MKPKIVVALGATAAQSLAGRVVSIQANRRKALDVSLNGSDPLGSDPLGSDPLRMFVTVHPSSLLRIPDETDRRNAYAGFVEDLRAIEEPARLSVRSGR